jgi:hypothetical protein
MKKWAADFIRQKTIFDKAANLKAAEEEGQNKSTLEIAMELLKVGVPDELISRATKLSKKTLVQIKQSMNKNECDEDGDR